MFCKQESAADVNEGGAVTAKPLLQSSELQRRGAMSHGMDGRVLTFYCRAFRGLGSQMPSP